MPLTFVRLMLRFLLNLCTLRESSPVMGEFPRNLPQARSLQPLLERLEQSIEAVVLIEINDEILVKRLVERGRDDDQPEIIKNRFKSYNAETQPLIPFYEDRGILFNIDGMKEVSKVAEDIKKLLSVY